MTDEITELKQRNLDLQKENLKYKQIIRVLVRILRQKGIL